MKVIHYMQIHSFEWISNLVTLSDLIIFPSVHLQLCFLYRIW
jgi:hypothetical protein